MQKEKTKEKIPNREVSLQLLFVISPCLLLLLAMGNSLRLFLCGKCGEPGGDEQVVPPQSIGSSGVTVTTSKRPEAKRFDSRKCAADKPVQPRSSGFQGVTSSANGVYSLAHDLLNFDATSLVPEELSNHVHSSKTAQAKWYQKLLQAWKESKPPPKTPEEASRLILITLHQHQQADVEGILAFYGLPLLVGEEALQVPSWVKGVKFEFQTLPVDAKSVTDGDSFIVYVDTADPGESANVPHEIHAAVIQRSNARSVKNYVIADKLHKTIANAGYRVFNGPNNEETLARKYRIRLRGIDAPESLMPFGKEAKEELTNLLQGHCLKIHVYDEDRYGRYVADVYCNGRFVQEYMLKKGLAWHYVHYDHRHEFSTWEKDARAASVGLWALPNPEKPWKWREHQRSGA